MEVMESNLTLINLNLNVGDQNYSNLDAASYPLSLRIVASPICFILLVIGSIGNSLVPFVVLRTKELRNSTNIFLINLSIADLLLLSVCTPTSLIELNSQPEVWFLGETMCKAVTFVEILVANGSILTILAISVERFYAICKPLQADYKCTKRRALTAVLIIWIISFTSAAPAVIITEVIEAQYIDGSFVPVCVNTLTDGWHPSYFVTTFILFFCVPFLVLIYIYVVIAKKLTRDSQIITCNRFKKQNRIRRQVVIMLASVCATFFICLLPFRIMILWIILSSTESIQDIGMEQYYNYLYFCRIMLYLNSSVNPVLYNAISTKFRKGFCKALGISGTFQRKPTTTNVCSQCNTASLTLIKYERNSPLLSFTHPNPSSFKDKP